MKIVLIKALQICNLNTYILSNHSQNSHLLKKFEKHFFLNERFFPQHLRNNAFKAMSTEIVFHVILWESNDC